MDFSAGPSVAERISARLDQMTSAERRAAQALVADYPMTGLKTVAEFSARAGVSSPTILRFVARIGFQSYPEFQAKLTEELSAQLQSPLSRTAMSASAQGASAADAAHPAVAAILENISETVGRLSGRQIDDVVALLCGRKARIYLAGGRFTDPIARYLAAHLALLRPEVHHLGGQETGWRDRLVDMNRRDVMVLFDIRRYQESLVRFAGAAHRRGVQIVLVTDQWLSPIARVARHVLPARTAAPSAWDSSAALFVLSEVLVAEVTRALAEQGSERIRAIENLRDG